jgi:methyltransferase (TIGR00027 family)
MAVARARAYHQVTDEPRMFTDPLALRIIGESALRDSEFDHGLDLDLVRHRRLLIAARSRFADDTVAAAVARGTGQVVILGAGLDTTAYRNTHEAVRFFEVDHPDTRERTRRQLSEVGIAIPSSLTFAPIDSERSTLAAGLAKAGLDRTRSALFSGAVSAGHAFVQNLRRGHYEFGMDVDPRHRLPVAFAELALTI